MTIFLSFLGIILTVFLETSLIPLPFTLLLLFFLAIFTDGEWVFFLALFGGFLLDSLFFRAIGTTEMFFVIVLGILFAYRRKFEVKSLPFLAGISATTVIVYAFIFSLQNAFVMAFLSLLVVIAGYFSVLFWESKRTHKVSYSN